MGCKKESINFAPDIRAAIMRETIANSSAKIPIWKPAIVANNGKMPVKNKNEIVTNEPSLEPKAAQSDLP